MVGGGGGGGSGASSLNVGCRENIKICTSKFKRNSSEAVGTAKDSFLRIYRHAFAICAQTQNLEPLDLRSERVI